MKFGGPLTGNTEFGAFDDTTECHCLGKVLARVVLSKIKSPPDTLLEGTIEIHVSYGCFEDPCEPPKGNNKLEIEFLDGAIGKTGTIRTLLVDWNVCKPCGKCKSVVTPPPPPPPPDIPGLRVIPGGKDDCVRVKGLKISSIGGNCQMSAGGGAPITPPPSTTGGACTTAVAIWEFSEIIDNEYGKGKPNVHRIKKYKNWISSLLADMSNQQTANIFEPGDPDEMRKLNCKTIKKACKELDNKNK